MFQVSVRPISSENTKESKKLVPVGRKESSLSLNPSEDQGNGSSPESVPLSSISSTQLIYVAADLDKLQDRVCAFDFTLKESSSLFLASCKSIKLFKVMYHNYFLILIANIWGV